MTTRSSNGDTPIEYVDYEPKLHVISAFITIPTILSVDWDGWFNDYEADRWESDIRRAKTKELYAFKNEFEQWMYTKQSVDIYLLIPERYFYFCYPSDWQWVGAKQVIVGGMGFAIHKRASR